MSGNVQKVYALEHDGTAEWNVFWDPIAAKQIWDTNIPITLCPLDLTNGVPVTSEFIRTLAKQRKYSISDLVGLCYSLAIPQDYYCWEYFSYGIFSSSRTISDCRIRRRTLLLLVRVRGELFLKVDVRLR